MILVVGPNPAIDRTAVVDRVVTDAILRPSEVRVQPGGKAMNVARAARALGALVVVSGICGGDSGHWLLEAASAEGLNPRFVDTGPETRTTYVVLDARGRSVLVYEPSGVTAPAAFDALVELVERELLPLADHVVLAGSLPRGIAPDGYARLVEASRRRGRHVLLDTSGPALVAGLAAGPDIAKVSLDEAREVLADGRRGPLEAARALVDAGASTAIVTDGSRGAAAFDGVTGWRVSAPRIATVDPIGSGDAFTAGLVVARSGGLPLEAALAWGTAAGAANAATLGAGHLDADDHQEALTRVRVERVDVGARR